MARNGLISRLCNQFLPSPLPLLPKEVARPTVIVTKGGDKFLPRIGEGWGIMSSPMPSVKTVKCHCWKTHHSQ